MTNVELKMALKLHHDWKVNFRRDYAMLLMAYTDGKILSMFESVVSATITLLHKHNIYDYAIDWHAVYCKAACEMHSIMEEVSDGKI